MRTNNLVISILITFLLVSCNSVNLNVKMTDQLDSFIVFMTDRNGQWEWYSMRSDGSEQTPFNISLPADNTIVGIWWEDVLGKFIFVLEDSQQNQDIYTYDYNKKDLKRITKDGVVKSEVAFSKKTSTYIFVCFMNGLNICKFSEKDNKFTQLTTFITNESSPKWINDENILFVSDNTGIPNIWSMDKNGGNLKNLSNVGFTEQNPSISNINQLIAFESQRDGNWNIFLMDFAGKGVSNLTKSDSTNVEPLWSPNGEWIAFLSNRNGYWEIFAISRDGSEVLSLSKNYKYPIQHFSWSPDGSALIWVAEKDDYLQIFKTNIQDQEIIQLTTTISHNNSPIWIH